MSNYDMHGTQLKCYPLGFGTNGSITIDGNELVAGMYRYALIADGQLIEKKYGINGVNFI